MGTTANFLKLRSNGIPVAGEWNFNYSAALAQAKNENRFIITCWSNGDLCSYCVKTETCMMTDTFKNWIKSSNAYFVFQCSDDANKGQDIYDWIFKSGRVKTYPGFRITLYDPNTGKIVVDKQIDGNTLRSKKINDYGARAMISNLEAIFAQRPALKAAMESSDNDETTSNYKIRLNEKLTVPKINKILDAIDNNDGYCPCQPKGPGTKCHCEDFINDKDIGEPCICKIYVKQQKTSVKAANAKSSKAVAKKSKKTSKK